MSRTACPESRPPAVEASQDFPDGIAAWSVCEPASRWRLVARVASAGALRGAGPVYRVDWATRCLDRTLQRSCRLRNARLNCDNKTQNAGNGAIPAEMLRAASSRLPAAMRESALCAGSQSDHHHDFPLLPPHIVTAGRGERSPPMSASAGGLDSPAENGTQVPSAILAGWQTTGHVRSIRSNGAADRPIQMTCRPDTR